ncbi:MAG: hypothetical protein ABIQ01_07590 [Pseudolysinimonas sp.]
MKSTIAHDVRITEAVPDVHRVELDGATVGYVQKEGAVFVSLCGSVYNTSCEVAQSLDLDTGVLAVIDAT